MADWSERCPEVEDEHLFVAQMDNARVLSTILKTVQFKEVTLSD